MTRLIVVCPAIIVLALLSYNVFYFVSMLQMGKVSVNSIKWLYLNAMSLGPALRGDVTVFINNQLAGMQSQM